MNKKTILRVFLLVALLLSLLVAFQSFSGKSLSRNPSNVVYKTDVVEKTDYEMPGIEIDESTARIISMSKEIALVNQEARLEEANAELNTFKSLSKQTAEEEKNIKGKASATLDNKVTTPPGAVEQDIENYRKQSGNTTKTTVKEKTVSVSIKSVLIPLEGVPSAMIAVNNGEHTLVKPGSVLGGVEVLNITKTHIDVLSNGKRHTVYVAN